MFSKKQILELDHWASQLRQFDEDVEQITALANIFSINISEYKT